MVDPKAMMKRSTLALQTPFRVIVRTQCQRSTGIATKLSPPNVIATQTRSSSTFKVSPARVISAVHDQKTRVAKPTEFKTTIPDSNTELAVAYSPLEATISVPKGTQFSVDPILLRDSCLCSKCKDAASGQKTYASVEIPTSISIKSVESSNEGLVFTFANDIPRFEQTNHQTPLPWEVIQRKLQLRMTPSSVSRPENVLNRTGIKFWDKRILEKSVRKIDYQEYMKGGEAFWDAVIDICRLGIVFLKNVPHNENSIEHITTKIANIRETFYGHTFDVRAKPNAENVAYTSGYLGLHQDLLYLTQPPMIQVLHCMENSCNGGESLFSDGERVARLLLSITQSQDGNNPFTDHQIPYEYNKNSYRYRQSRPIIETVEGNQFSNVYWSPPFQGVNDHFSGESPSWLAATKTFHDLINAENAIWQGKMQAGECVLFNNLRVMHGRRAFDSTGGSRWLRGAYIASDDFLSKACHIPKDLTDKYRGEEISISSDHPEWTEETISKLEFYYGGGELNPNLDV